VKDVVVVGKMLFVYYSTMSMWDDILTKGLPIQNTCSILRLLGLENPRCDRMGMLE
jgi:hypothetical protein